MEESIIDFVGIIEGPREDNITISILNNLYKSCFVETFDIEREFFDFPGEEELSNYADKPDLANFNLFISQHIENPNSAQFLLELPNLFWRSDDDPEGQLGPWDRTLYSLVKQDSIYLKILAFLSGKNYIHWGCTRTNEQDTIAIVSMPYNSDFAVKWHRQPKYLNQNISRVYAEFLLDKKVGNSHSAVISSLLCKNKGAYCYWSSFGQVQSSQDVIGLLRSGSSKLGAVVSDFDVYTLYTNSKTKQDELEKVALKYAVTAKKYSFLGENNAIKVALLNVCKLWNIILTCERLELSDSEEESEVIEGGTIEEEDKKDTEDLEDLFEGLTSFITSGKAVYPQAHTDEWITQILLELQ